MRSDRIGQCEIMVIGMSFSDVMVLVLLILDLSVSSAFVIHGMSFLVDVDFITGDPGEDRTRGLKIHYTSCSSTELPGLCHYRTESFFCKFLFH